MRKILPVLLLAALPGCDLEAEAEADRVCVAQTFASRTVPGAPPGTNVTVTSPLPFLVDIGAAIPEDLEKDGVDADVFARSIALTTTQGVDLSGIQSARLTLVAPGRPDVIFRYARPAGATGAITAIAAVPDVPVDLVDYLQGQSAIQLQDVTLSGQPPAQAWTPTLETCGSAKVTVDYLDAL